jgi:hypothetical protein
MTTKIVNIYLVDQNAIASSCGRTSLFLNEVHIIDTREDTNIIKLAEKLKKALNCKIRKIKLLPEQLAGHIAHQRGETSEFIKEAQALNPNYSKWIASYNKNDLWGAIQPQILFSNSNRHDFHSIKYCSKKP